ncbi:MAG: SDR family NAD(P)-dependent oxidoreductase [Desulfobacterales bacterium]|nr:SDR family NAD(P)-dependent oxidoreductase [Desulfobacterales bacterium]
MAKHTQRSTPVAVIGLGCFFPRATGTHAYWHLLYHGKDAITNVPASHWSPEEYFDVDPSRKDHVYCRRGGFISPIDFDPTEFGIPPSNLESTDSSQLIGLMAAKTALETAGYGSDVDFDRDRTSVILGVTGTQELVIPLSSRLSWPKWKKALKDARVDPVKARQVMESLADEYVEWQENSFPGLLGNVVAGRICNRLDLNGTNCVVDAACASSMSAINLALLELYTGRSDMVVTGGVDTLNDIFMHMCFARTQILSPTGDARPFSQDADGTVLGEGVGVLILKRLEEAESDGDRILAVIRGIGASSDGKSQSIYAPRAEGQLKALRRAYTAAGVEPRSVDLIEAHGTGTRVGDKIEVQALKMLFDEDGTRRHCALGSVKSMIGHTKAAAGSAGLIKTVLALHHKILPPTLKAETPDPDIGLEDSPFYLNKTARPWFRRHTQPRRAGVSAFGFGGSNFHMVLEEYQTERTAVSWDGSIEIMALAAETQPELMQALGAARQSLEETDGSTGLPHLAARLRQAFDPDAPFRLILVLQREEDDSGPVWNWPAVFEEATQAFETHGDQPFWFGRSCFFGQGPIPGPVAFLFPGQGSQYLHMGQDWVAWFPEALAALESADGHFGQDTPLTDYIYPPAEAGQAKTREEALRNTAVAQPAIGAVSVAMEKVLRRFGVRPEFTCGHSYGELAALYSAGWIDEATLYTLSVLRGQLMAAAGGPDGASSGTMLAVKAPLEKLASLLASDDLDVVLANRNSPSQGVLSGSVEAIAQAEAACKNQKFRTIRLPVAAAFHSKLMQEAQAPFAAALENTRFEPSETQVFANTTGKPYPLDPEAIKAILGDHLLNPVNFVDEISNLYQAGVRIFIEVGPKTVLSGLVRQILKGQPIHALATDAGSGRTFGIEDLATLLGKLAALGASVDFSQWEAPNGNRRRSRMQIPISGANFRKSRNHQKAGAAAAGGLPDASRPVDIAVPQHRPARAENDPPAVTAGVAFDPSQAADDSARPNPNDAPATMNNINTGSDSRLADTFNLVQQGLHSLQSLQQQTTAAHQKFLETQQQASRTLQEMMASTRRLAETLMGAGQQSPEQLSSLATPPSPGQTAQPVHATEARPAAAPSSVQVSAPPSANPGVAVPPPDQPAPAPPDPQPTSGTEQVLRQVVSELTGYPESMLGMEMDLESDLGIDSIKRVEILSTLEERLASLPDTRPETMAGFRTLGEVAAFLGASPQVPAQEKPTARRSHPPAASPLADENVAAILMSVVSELTGYPTDMLNLDMNVESDLGIDSIKRVEILSAIEDRLPDLAAVTPEEMADLKTLGQIAAKLAPAAGATKPTAVSARDAAPPPAGGSVAETVMAVVSDLTGYPVEMLAPEMEIESDLGIDSIKRVEILSTLEDRLPDLPSVAPETMAELKTLGQIIAHLGAADHEPPVHPPAKTPAADSPPDAAPVASTLRRVVKAVPAEITSDPRIKPPAGRRVYLTTDKAGLSHALAEALAQAGLRTVQISADILAHRDQLPDACGLIIVGDAEAETGDRNGDDQALAGHAFRLMHHLGPSLQEAARQGGAFLATVARMDGQHGFGDGSLAHPLQGALAGLAKTAALEWEGVTCRALDAASDWRDNPRIAEMVVATLLQPAAAMPVEIGLAPDRICRLALDAAAVSADAPDPIDLPDHAVVVVSGGARGVTAAAVIELARQRPLTFILLGRSDPPIDEPAWLHDLNGKRAIKEAIITHAFERETPTPQAVEAYYRRLMCNREINATLAAVAATGSTARYYAVDIGDSPKLEAVINDARLVHGPVKALIHGAGILRDRLIVEKTPEQFARVFDTKVKGLQNLLRATTEDPLGWIILFSSVAARFGNVGQADYAAANEALNKIAQSESRHRPACRIKSINWGPWDGGMVSTALKKAFARRGIPLLPLAAGTRALVSEMRAASDGAIEVVIGAEIPAPDAIPHAEARPISKAPPEEAKITTAYQSEVSLERYPILDDHRLDGNPVVPMALIAEWLGHGALHDHPGMLLAGLEDMRLLKGIVLENDRPRPIRVLASGSDVVPEGYKVRLELHNGQTPDEGLIHCRATALVSDRFPEPPVCTIPPSLTKDDYARAPKAIYADILFHGLQLQGLRRVAASSRDGMRAEIDTAPRPSRWIKNPARNHWIADPLVMDGAFQMASLWCYEQSGKVSLPSYFSAYRQYCRRFPAGSLQAVMVTRELTPHKMIGDFYFLTPDQKVVATIHGFEAIMDAQLMQAFKPGRSHAA